MGGVIDLGESALPLCENGTTTIDQFETLVRIQTLPLSAALAAILYSPSPREYYEEEIPTPRIIQAFSQLFSEGPYTLSLYQTLNLGNGYIVIVDMEASQSKKVRQGVMTPETSIFTAGPAVQVLASTKLRLMRPFSPKPPGHQSVSNDSQGRGGLQTQFRNWMESTIWRGSHSEELQMSQPHTSTNSILLIDLVSLLQTTLRETPSLVFVCGREVLIPCPRELKLSTLDPWDSYESNVEEPPSCPPAQEAATVALLKFIVTSTGEVPLGVIVPGTTQVDIRLDDVGEFSRVQIAPIMDTVPQSYDFNFFESYLKPFLLSFPLQLYSSGEILYYQGLQFKIQRTLPATTDEVTIPDINTVYWKSFLGIMPFPIEPRVANNNGVMRITSNDCEAWQCWKHQKLMFRRNLVWRRNKRLCARIGPQTRIHLAPPVRLHWIEFFPPERVEEIQRLPTRLQPFAVIHAISELATADIARIMEVTIGSGGESSELSRNEMMVDSMADQIVEQFARAHDPVIPNNEVCVVCLECLESEVKIIELSCSHVFHAKCVKQWLKKSFLCPICKRDLSESIKPLPER